MEYFDLLPSEITMDIISRLPTESVLECKLVCSNWRNIICYHPSFSKMHLDHLNHPASDSGKLGFIALTYMDERIVYSFQYFEYNDENHEFIERIKRVNFNPPFRRDTRFIGSCNGLICYHLRENTCIFNPITREYFMLPEIKRAGMVHRGSGFGYVSSTNEYKVVRIMYEKKTKFIEVYIYTLGSGHGWRNLGKFNFGSIDGFEEGVYVNEVLYWLDYELEMIVPFNLAEEKFCELLSPPPPLSDSDFDDWYKLGVLDGCLYFAINLRVSGAECWNVWLLRKKDDNHDMKDLERHQSFGWREEVSVSDRLNSELFAVTKSYAVLTYTRKHINIHDPEVSTWEAIVDFNEHIGEVFPHKNTLVSLKELGEEDTKIMEGFVIAGTENIDYPFNQLQEDETPSTNL